MKPSGQKKNPGQGKNNKIYNFLKKYYPFVTIGLVGFLLYFKTTSYLFSPLDDTLIIKNRMEWLLDRSNFNEVFTRGTFTKPDSHAPDYYRPLLTLSFKIDAIIGKGKIWYFHFSNILLHIIASMLCFVLLTKFLSTEKSAFIFSLLFTVHPAFAHAIAWIPGRNDTLLAVFTFASVLFYINYVKDNKPIALLISLLFYLFALFTKENVVFLPVLLIGIEYLIHNRLRYKQILIALSGWIIATAFWWIIRSMVVSTAPVVNAIDPFSAVLKSIAPLMIYIGKIILPFNLAVLPNVSDTSKIPGIIVLIAFLFLSIRFRYINIKLALFGIFWFILFLLIPLVYSTLTGEGLQYEHRLYIPIFGIILTISQLKITIPEQNIVSALVIILFSIKTIIRCGVYENTLSFARAAVRESPSLAMSHNMMGIEYNNMGQYKNAIDEYTKALEIEPEKYIALFNRANSFNNMKEYNMALKDYNIGLLKDSLNAKAICDRGNVYSDMRRYDEAIADYTKAIKIYPEYSNAYNNRGNVFANLKEYEKAIEDYSMAINFRPANASAYNNRSNAYGSLMKYSNALEDINKAISLNPDDKDFRQNRNAILAELKKINGEKSADTETKFSFVEQQLLPAAYQLYNSKQYDKAKDIFYKLYIDAKTNGRLRNAASHYNNVGLCYLKMNNLVEAEKVFKSIITLYPDNEKAYLNLGLLYKLSGNSRLALDFYKKALEISPNDLNAKAEVEKLQIKIVRKF